MLQDITKVRELETEAANAALFLKTIFDLMPCTATVRECESGKLIMANKKYCSQMNMAEEKVIGSTYEELFEPEIAKNFQEMDDEAVRKNGEVSTHVIRVPGQNGEIMAQISHIAFTDTTGRLH